MKLKHTLIVASLVFASVNANSQDKAKPATPAKAATPSADQKASMEADKAKEAEAAWMAYASPSEMHKMLMSDEGNWHEELTFWMAPGAPESKAESECQTKQVLGGRYLESIHTGNMMGMPFEGHGTIGYDNSLKVLQSTWADNMGTGIMFLQGKYDEKSKSSTMTGSMVDPGSGKVEKVRQVYTWVDNNTRKLEMYMTSGGKEFKNMEIKMTRR
jgi:hypothetical protein